MATDDLRRAADSFWMASKRRNTIPGRLGKPDGDGTYTVRVANRPGYAYVRLGPEGNQGITLALNLGAPYKANLPVEMQRVGDLGPYIILGADSSGGRLEQFSGNSDNTYSVGPHTHAIGSGLEYEIEALRLEPGRVRPYSGLEVYIDSCRYFYNNAWETWPGGILDLTSNQPSTTSYWAWVLVGIDPATNTATAVTGTEYPVTAPLPIELLDDIDFVDYIPCAGIRIKESDTVLTAISRYADAHGWFNSGGATSSFVVDSIMTDANGSIMVDASGNVMIEG